MPEYGRWEESKGRIDDRFQRIEKTLESINGNTSKLIWIGLTAFLTLLGHVVVSYLQMKGPG